MSTKNNPGPFDCYVNAEDDEPMFVLLGRDPTASLVVEWWIELQNKLNTASPEKLEEAKKCVKEMKKWAEKKKEKMLFKM